MKNLLDLLPIAIVIVLWAVFRRADRKNLAAILREHEAAERGSKDDGQALTKITQPCGCRHSFAHRGVEQCDPHRRMAARRRASTDLRQWEREIGGHR